MPSVTRIRVRYKDTDTMSVVYYGNYLTYFAVAWVEYLRERGLPISQVDKRVHLPVVEALVRYVKPARLDDLLGPLERRVRPRGQCRLSRHCFDWTGLAAEGPLPPT